MISVSKVRVYIDEDDLTLLNEHIIKGIHQHKGFKCLNLKPCQSFRIATYFMIGRDLSIIKRRNKLYLYSDYKEEE